MKKVFSFILFFPIALLWNATSTVSSPVENLNRDNINDQQSISLRRIDISKIKFSEEDKKKIMELAILFGNKHKENIRNNLKKILGELYYKEIPDKFIIGTQIGHLETAEEIAKKLILLGVQIRNAKKNHKIEIKNAAKIETFCYRAAFLHYKKFLEQNLERLNLGKKFSLMLDMVLCLKYAMHSSDDIDEKTEYKDNAIKSLQNILKNLAFHEHKYFAKLFIIYLDDMQAIAENISLERLENVVKIKKQINEMMASIKSYNIGDAESKSIN